MKECKLQPPLDRESSTTGADMTPDGIQTEEENEVFQFLRRNKNHTLLNFIITGVVCAGHVPQFVK